MKIVQEWLTVGVFSITAISITVAVLSSLENVLV